MEPKESKQFRMTSTVNGLEIVTEEVPLALGNVIESTNLRGYRSTVREFGRPVKWTRGVYRSVEEAIKGHGDLTTGGFNNPGSILHTRFINDFEYLPIKNDFKMYEFIDIMQEKREHGA
ncbi:MAG: hypothetical protein AABX23_03530 [Nanoarchaeota archaeon]